MKSDPYLALRNREFRFFLLMRMCTTLAVQIQAVVVGWQIYELTNKDTLALGFIGLTEAIPAIAIALYAGHLVDMHSRRKIIFKVLLVVMIGSALLCLTTLETTQQWIGKPILPIFIFVFIIGLARGFIAPANFAFLTQIVNTQELPNAIAWNSTNWQTAAVAGPALGGLLYGFLGLTVTYAIQTILLGLAIVSLYQISPKPSPPKPEAYDLGERLWSGVRFVFQNQLILAAISLDLFAVLFGGAVALLPAFASDILHVDTIGLGFLRAAPAFGAILNALLMAYQPIKKGAGIYLLACVAGFGGCMIFFALSTDFWLSLILLFLSGMFDSVSVIIRSNILQLHTPEAMKGRVSSVNSIFISSSNELGAFESGVAARLMGVVPSVIFGGCMTIGVVLTTAFFAQKLRKLNL